MFSLCDFFSWVNSNFLVKNFAATHNDDYVVHPSIDGTGLGPEEEVSGYDLLPAVKEDMMVGDLVLRIPPALNQRLAVVALHRCVILNLAGLFLACPRLSGLCHGAKTPPDYLGRGV